MMGSFQPSYLQLLYLLIAALLECKVASKTTCKQVHHLNINYVQGENMSISCLTTTHPLESLTVKLRRTNPVQHILNYSDTSPVSEHQRWSVRNDAGNVTLYLKDISLSDQGRYEFEIHKNWDCLDATFFNLRVKECKNLDPVHGTPESSVLLPCSELRLHHKAGQVNWKIMNGHNLIDLAQFRPPHKPSNSTDKVQKPLYERARTLGNGSLLIREAVNTDGSWYQCRVNEKNCYELKLVMKGEALSTTLLSTVIPDVSTSAHTQTVQTEGNIETSAAVTTNLIAVVMVTVVSLCIFITLIICVILYFKKGNKSDNKGCKSNNKIELNEWSCVYYSNISGRFDVPFNSLVEHKT